MKLITFIFSLMTIYLSAQNTPKELGYHFPDEWEVHEGTMMIFPAMHGYGRQAPALQREFSQLARAIAENEKVIVFCYTKDAGECERLLKDVTNLEIKVGDFRIDWARDNAPMVICNAKGELASAGFRFNGWGKKYRGWQEDRETRDNIAKAMKWKTFHSDFVLEGGAIEIGNDIGIVTESCVLNKNRTDWAKGEVEAELKDMLGLDKVIWLKSGLMPDKVTDGHVDGLLKWVRKDTVLLHTTNLKSDVNYSICQNAKKELIKHGVKVIELPLMDDVVHMNFYIGSGGDVVYVPVCGDPEQDDPALAVIRKLYKKVVPIKAVAIAKAGGGIHCYTQQIPVGK